MPHQKIKIFDTTLRDGEQCPGASLNHEEKIKIARQLERLGVDIIEAGFPIASPDDFRAVNRIAKLVTKSTICGLSRAVEKDIETAAEAIAPAKKKRIHTFLATSDLHLKFKLKMTRAKALQRIEKMVALARSKCHDVEFSPEDGSRTDPRFLWKALEAAIRGGATTLNIPDTVGYSTPDEFGKIITNIRKNVRGIKNVVISVHCHNDLGLATANALVAVQNGARQIECTINGIGERAGNTSLEEVVMAIRTRKDFFKNLKTGIKNKELYRTSKLVSNLTGFAVPPNKAIVGSNAFAHESGIHQHGILAKRETYEIMKAEDIGLAQNKLVLGKHSGRTALSSRLKKLGFEFSTEELKNIFDKFKQLADKKKEVFDEDLEAIVSQELGTAEATWIFKEVEIIAGTRKKPVAEVILQNSAGEKFRKKSRGAGPVDATYSAVNSIIKEKVKLLDFRMDAVSAGIDAQAVVTVKVESAEQKIYSGRGSHTDIIVASVKSYLNALNKVISGKERMKTVSL